MSVVATRRRPGPPKGCVVSPERRAAISAAAAEYRGFSDQEVVQYYQAPHSVREAAEWFGLTFQRISQILGKYGASRPRGPGICRSVRS